MANGKFVLRAYLRTELYHIIMYNPILLCSLMFGYNIPSHRSITIINNRSMSIKCGGQQSNTVSTDDVVCSLATFVRSKENFITVFCQVAATVLLKIQK
jgi:hypothetical protein